uniref:NR LBD domain-containing protein n=1 Tax=Panagrolaimus superbus TaxID=310955 RepID=A0A914YQ94_9BILA
MKSDELPRIKSPTKLQRNEKINNHPKPFAESPLKSTTINVEKVYHEVQKILEQESKPHTALDNFKSTKKFAEVLSKQLNKSKKLINILNSEKKHKRGEYYEKFLADVAHLLLNIEYYSSLSFSQKFALYKRFWQMFQLLLNCYQAYVCYGNDLTDMRYPIDNDHFIDLEKTITQDHNEATLFLIPVLMKSKMLLIHIKKICPTIFEFAYICQVMLWSCAEIEELTGETCLLAEEMLQKASDELHDYYVNEMHMHNYAARQAELIV